MSDITPLSPATLAKDEAEAVQHNFWTRKALALDYFLNVWLFNGRLDETISAHAARAAEEGKLWGHLLVRFLDLFDSNHGVHAQAGDLARAEVIVTLEESTLPKS
jgi:hypothetical protein